MKTEFKDLKHQVDYINKVVSRNTTLKKVCQYCGKPAFIKYNKNDPYKIQLVCKDCRIGKHSDRDGMLRDIPIIDIKKHLNKEKIKRENFKVVNEENDKKIKFLLNTKLPKVDAIKAAKLTLHQYELLVDTYEYEKDMYIRGKLNSNFRKNRANNLKKSTINRNFKKYSNNLYKIKSERNLSNEDLSKLAGGRITSQHMCIISTDKCEPKIKTKCILAESLNLSVTDIFPEDTLYKDIYSYEDYLKFIDNFILKFKNYIEINKVKSTHNTICIISKKTKIRVHRLYDFLSKRGVPKHSEILKINEEILKTF